MVLKFFSVKSSLIISLTEYLIGFIAYLRLLNKFLATNISGVCVFKVDDTQPSGYFTDSSNNKYKIKIYL